MALAAATLAASSAAAQGQNIGDPTGQIGQWPKIVTPPGNPFSADPADPHVPLPGSITEAKALLGLAVFWDEQFSTDKTMACATCHLPEVAGVDPRLQGVATNNGFGSFGVMPQDALKNFVAGIPLGQEAQVTPIVAPSMMGSAFAERVLWDASAGPAFAVPNGQIDFNVNAALEAQAVGPLLNTIEMANVGHSFTAISNELNSARVLALATPATVPAALAPIVSAGITYDVAFDAVFGGDPNFGGPIGVTRERIAMAIATYERTLIPDQAPVDTRGLTPAEQNGFNHLAQSLCFHCHSNQTSFFAGEVPVLTGTGGFVNPLDAMLTDNRVHGPIGFPDTPGAQAGTPAKGSFSVKTPSLRNVRLKPRFAHNGAIGTFAQLMQFYNGQLPGTNPVFTFRSGTGPGGRLTNAELGDVTAFFDALTDPRLVPGVPGAQLPMPFSHPDLYSDRVPSGSNEPAHLPGTPAPSGVLVPDIIAHVPAIQNDPNFKLGVRGAPSLAPAVLGFSPNPLPLLTPPGPLMLNPTGLVTLNFATDANGFANFQLGSASAAVAGQTFSFQWAVFDAAGAGFAFSNAAEIIVQ